MCLAPPAALASPLLAFRWEARGKRTLPRQRLNTSRQLALDRSSPAVRRRAVDALGGVADAEEAAKKKSDEAEEARLRVDGEDG